MHLRQLRQRTNALAASFSNGRSTTHAEWHIGTDLSAETHERLLAEAEIEELIATNEHSGGVTGATGHACRNRDVLFDADGNLWHVGLLLQKQRSTHGEIVAVIRYVERICEYSIFVGARDLDHIMQTYRLHDHLDFVIAIFPLADDIEKNIDLTKSFNGNVHYFSLPFT